jgi:hypothetical protein
MAIPNQPSAPTVGDQAEKHPAALSTGPARPGWRLHCGPRRDQHRASLAADPPHRTTGEYAFYRAYSPTQVPVKALVKVAGRRSTIEESFAASKELAALNEHRVRIWSSWHGWTALTIWPTHSYRVMAATEPAPADCQALIPLTRNEIGRLLTVIAPIHKAEYVLQGSTGRRQHQARARASYYARRTTGDD